MDNTAARLTEAIRIVAPIDGLSLGRERRVRLHGTLTPEQRAAADAVIANFDWTDAANEYKRKRAAEWAASPWNAAAQNSAMIKAWRGDASEITALSQFDLSVRAKHPKPGG